MTIRCTLFCPQLAQFPAKGISPDGIKTMSVSEIIAQTKINNNFNARGYELGDILELKLKNIDMTWCKDGRIVISCDNTMAEIEKVIADEGLEIRPDRSEIKHKIRPVSNEKNAAQEEDIDEVFEPKTIGELKLLKSRSLTNQFKLKSLTEVI